MPEEFPEIEVAKCSVCGRSITNKMGFITSVEGKIYCEQCYKP